MGLENQFSVLLRVAVLLRSYCTTTAESRYKKRNSSACTSVQPEERICYPLSRNQLRSEENGWTSMLCGGKRTTCWFMIVSVDELNLAATPPPPPPNKKYTKTNKQFDQEMPQSQTSDLPMAHRHPLDSNTTILIVRQPALSSP